MTDALDKQIERVTARSPEERQRASLAVASRARDEDDCRELLAALGLLPPKPRRQVGYNAAGHPKWAEG